MSKESKDRLDRLEKALNMGPKHPLTEQQRTRIARILAGHEEETRALHEQVAAEGFPNGPNGDLDGYFGAICKARHKLFPFKPRAVAAVVDEVITEGEAAVQALTEQDVIDE